MPTTYQLPPSTSLFVVTPGAIHTYNQSQQSLFECTTAGIVNAKAAQDNSSLLAVADSHLVILHDSTHRNDRKYRLKGADVRSKVYVYTLFNSE
jgi:hypothetical protein